MKKKTLKFHIQCKLMKASLERLTPNSSVVLCPASLLKWISCSLCFTEKAKWSIYKTSKGGKWGRERRANRSWLLVQRRVGQVQTISVSMPFHSLTLPLAAGNVCLSSCCLFSLLSSLLLDFDLTFPLCYLPLSYFISHTLSLVFISLHLCLSTSTKHWSNAQWVIWFSSQTILAGV